jgi:hypothetical protein
MLDGLLKSIVTPVAQDLGLEVRAAHQMVAPGMITNQVIEALLEDALVVADLTSLNANVMYELAIRHAARLPVVTIAQTGTKLPFDVGTERTIFYSHDFQGREDLLPQLRAAAESALNQNEPDNPVYRAAKFSVMRDVTAGTPDSFLIDRLDQLTSQVERLSATRLKIQPGERWGNRWTLAQRRDDTRTPSFEHRSVTIRTQTPQDRMQAEELVTHIIRMGAEPVSSGPSPEGDLVFTWKRGPTLNEVLQTAVTTGTAIIMNGD